MTRQVMPLNDSTTFSVGGTAQPTESTWLRLNFDPMPHARGMIQIANPPYEDSGARRRRREHLEAQLRLI